jgi:hypothetical protein
LTDLPNVGESIAADLHRLGIAVPGQLIGQCPYRLYERLCESTGKRHDLCLLDVFISITRFMGGDDARPWWDFTRERKRTLAGQEYR